MALLYLLLSACATRGAIDAPAAPIDSSRLPTPNVSMNIAGLGPCTDNPDRTLHFDARAPVTVLVHGCFGSSGLFRGLAQVLAFHGQQTACFSYNDRDSMMLSSRQLDTALLQLADKMENKFVTVLGHSQGALVARKALVRDRPDPLPETELRLRLVTVSGPFAGIAAARHCGSPLARTLSLGVVNLICQAVTGDKWSEITYSAPFIVEPGRLNSHVVDYLKIDTDERGSCRHVEGGRCMESDEIFSLAEQTNADIAGDPHTRVVAVKAGHVEIIGDKRVEPRKLIAVLQENGIINPTQPERLASFYLLLQHLYASGP